MTNRCVRSCPYCFARRELQAPAAGDTVSWEDVVYVADFLERSGEKRLSLLGGEPTLHPHFVDLVLYLRERDFDVTVFTSGVLSPGKLRDVLAHLTAIPPGPLNFVCNLNDPEQTPAETGERDRLAAFLDAMGPWVTPGFNIYRVDFRLDFLFDLVGRYGLGRHLRLGVAHPVPNAPSSHIRPEQYRAVIERLCSYRPLFDRFDVKPGLDCGFPLCQFTDEELGWLTRHTGGASHFQCGAAIDIAPDMSVYACFPFSRVHRRSLYEFDSLQQIADYYQELNRDLRAELPGIYEECDGCRHRAADQCSGGGACHLMTRLLGEAPVRLPEVERALAETGGPRI
ncbi:MAG TPA: radical SAM protein [Polyangia bacterium]